MKVAKRNTIVYIKSFEGCPLVRCTLKGVYRTTGFPHIKMFVVKPLETKQGYIKGGLDTCREIVPASCVRWREKGLKFAPKPFIIDWGSLPTYEAGADF